MNSIRLYKFKDSISRKMHFLGKESNLDILDDPIHSAFLDVEIITEYVISIPNANDFTCKDLSYKELLQLCSSAKETIEHYFIKNNNNYDMV